MRKNQDGDTIIEVLIAIAIVASVLGITYSIMNRNLAIMRNNQERTEATRIGESQVEALKSRVQTASGEAEIAAISDSQPFCIEITSGNIDYLSSAVPASNLATANLSSSAYDTCIRSFYSYVIRRNAPGDPTFTITVRWDTISRGRGEVRVVYRIP